MGRMVECFKDQRQRKGIPCPSCAADVNGRFEWIDVGRTRHRCSRCGMIFEATHITDVGSDDYTTAKREMLAHDKQTFGHRWRSRPHEDRRHARHNRQQTS